MGWQSGISCAATVAATAAVDESNCVPRFPSKRGREAASLFPLSEGACIRRGREGEDGSQTNRRRQKSFLMRHTSASFADSLCLASPFQSFR